MYTFQEKRHLLKYPNFCGGPPLQFSKVPGSWPPRPPPPPRRRRPWTLQGDISRPLSSSQQSAVSSQQSAVSSQQSSAQQSSAQPSSAQPSSAQQAVKPPSTGRVTPLMSEAWSLRRNTTAFTMSSTSPNLLRGTNFIAAIVCSAFSAVSNAFFPMSVAGTRVGLTQLTRMPCGPSSSVITRIRWSSAALEAQ